MVDHSRGGFERRRLDSFGSAQAGSHWLCGGISDSGHLAHRMGAAPDLPLGQFLHFGGKGQAKVQPPTSPDLFRLVASQPGRRSPLSCNDRGCSFLQNAPHSSLAGCEAVALDIF